MNQQARQPEPDDEDRLDRNGGPSDPRAVEAKKKKAQQIEDIRQQGLRYIMADRRGRAWMCHLLQAKLFTPVGTLPLSRIFTGNSSTFYNTGHREVGDVITHELKKLTKPEYRLMEDEAEASNA